MLFFFLKRSACSFYERGDTSSDGGMLYDAIKSWSKVLGSFLQKTSAGDSPNDMHSFKGIYIYGL